MAELLTVKTLHEIRSVIGNYATTRRRRAMIDTIARHVYKLVKVLDILDQPHYALAPVNPKVGNLSRISLSGLPLHEKKPKSTAESPTLLSVKRCERLSAGYIHHTSKPAVEL